MKGYILIISIFLISGLFIGGCSQKVNQEQVLSKFYDQVITVNDLEKAISELPEWKQESSKDQKGKEDFLKQMAEDRFLSRVAVEMNYSKFPEIVKQTKEYRDQLMLRELVKQEVDDKLKITDADLEKYYSEHKPDYVEPEKIVVTEVTLKDEAKAKEVMDKIKAGSDFAELAKEMDAKGESFGPSGQGSAGKTRPFSRDSYSSAKEFVEAAFSLELNKVSDIIVQPMGQDTYYMIVRLDEKIPSRQKEFSEVKDDISRTVERDKKRERIDQWLAELKKDTKFELYADKITLPVEKKEVKPEEQKGEEKVPGKETPAPAETKPDNQGEKTQEKSQ